MKKLLCVLLVLTMLFAMAGCGGSGGTQAPGTNPPATDQPENTTPPDNNPGNEEEPLDWPNKTIEVVCAFGAGGDTDYYTRLFADYLSKELGVTAVVVNMAGANGATATMDLHESPADGYRMLIHHDTFLTNKALGTSDYGPDDFELCGSIIYDNSYVLCVNSSSPYYSLDDVLEAARANPNTLTYGSGVGGYSYFVGRMLEEITGVDISIVDVGGGTETNAALLANKIDLYMNCYGTPRPYIESGDFRVLCALSPERNDVYPDVPTTAELGVDWTASRYYFGFFPKGTDSRIVEKVSEIMEKFTNDPEIIQQVQEAYATVPVHLSPDELYAYQKDKLSLFENNVDLITG